MLTRPHVSCIGVNVALDAHQLQPARCPQFRPGYKCHGPAIFYHYSPGSWQVNCDKSEAFVPESFPKDHLRDVFNAWSVVDSAALATTFVPAQSRVTVFITRERYTNYYFTNCPLACFQH